MHPAPVCRRRSGGTSTVFILRATRGKRPLTGLTLWHKHNPDRTLRGLAFYNGRTILHAARVAGEHALTMRFHGSRTITVFVVRLTCCMAAAATGAYRRPACSKTVIRSTRDFRHAGEIPWLAVPTFCIRNPDAGYGQPSYHARLLHVHPCADRSIRYKHSMGAGSRRFLEYRRRFLVPRAVLTIKV